MTDPGYFKDMEVVDNRLKKLEFQVSKLSEVLHRIKELIESRNAF